jgi:hypothetical protein
MIFLIAHRISFAGPYIVAHIHPESDKEIDNERGAHCKKRNINKVLTDSAGSNAHSFTQPGANSKNIPFYHSA